VSAPVLPEVPRLLSLRSFGALRASLPTTAVRYRQVGCAHLLRPGSGGESVFGGKGGRFKDDKGGLALQHDAAGVLSMGNSGKNSNTSQFFLTLAPAPQCDGKHVVGHRCAVFAVLLLLLLLLLVVVVVVAAAAAAAAVVVVWWWWRW